MIAVTDQATGDPIPSPFTNIVEVSSANLDELRSSVSGMAELGKVYEVQFIAGLSNESQFELLQHAP